MPYVITVNTLKPAYPSLCPFCSKRYADSYFVKEYKKPKWAIPTPAGVVARYERHMITYPVCKKCKRTFIWLKWIGCLLIILPWIAFLYVIFNNIEPCAVLGDTLLRIAVGAFLLAIFLFVLRSNMISKFRVGYVGNDSVLFFSKKKKFADEFARLNHTVSEYKFLVVKFR